MASDQQEAWLIMPGKAGSNVMTGVNSLPNDETDAAELRKAQSFGSSAHFPLTLNSGRGKSIIYGFYFIWWEK